MAKFSSGSTNRQHLLDYVLEDRPGSGPFAGFLDYPGFHFPTMKVSRILGEHPC